MKLLTIPSFCFWVLVCVLQDMSVVGLGEQQKISYWRLEHVTIRVGRRASNELAGLFSTGLDALNGERFRCLLAHFSILGRETDTSDIGRSPSPGSGREGSRVVVEVDTVVC